MISKKRLTRLLAEKACGPLSRLLVAPSGDGDDLQYLPVNIAATGIIYLDVARLTLSRIGLKAMSKIEGDILHLAFRDNTFDLVLAALFFHRVTFEGYEQYLAEYYRVIRPAG